VAASCGDGSWYGCMEEVVMAVALPRPAPKMHACPSVLNALDAQLRRAMSNTRVVDRALSSGPSQRLPTTTLPARAQWATGLDQRPSRVGLSKAARDPDASHVAPAMIGPRRPTEKPSARPPELTTLGAPEALTGEPHPRPTHRPTRSDFAVRQPGEPAHLRRSPAPIVLPQTANGPRL
jgi:hypothetical protein